MHERASTLCYTYSACLVLSIGSFCLFHLFSFTFPLLIVPNCSLSLPHSLFIARSPPLPIPIYICCHGDSLYKGLTSCICCTYKIENIFPNNSVENEVVQPAFCFKHGLYIPTCGVGFTNSPLKVRRLATPDLAGGYTNNSTLSRGVRSLPQFLQLTQQH